MFLAVLLGMFLILLIPPLSLPFMSKTALYYYISDESNTDDTDQYMSVSSNNPVNDLIQCITNKYQHWMTVIFLQLNQDKTEIPLVHPKTLRLKKLSFLTTLSVKLLLACQKFKHDY